MVRPDLSAEADAPEQIAHRHVVAHVDRGDEGGEDDASLAAVDDVVVVVAEGGAGSGAHRGRVRIGR
jgi:hypothetical protein